MCACNGGKKTLSTSDSSVFVVTLPNGSTEDVTGEHQAKVRATMTGGTYRRK